MNKTVFKEYIPHPEPKKWNKIRITVMYWKERRAFTAHFQPCNSSGNGAYSIDEYEPMEGKRLKLMEVGRYSTKAAALAIEEMMERRGEIINSFKTVTV